MKWSCEFNFSVMWRIFLIRKWSVFLLCTMSYKNMIRAKKILNFIKAIYEF